MIVSKNYKFFSYIKFEIGNGENFELKILSEFELYDRVSPRSNWQITVYIALIGLGGWVGGWVDGEAGLRIAYSNQK